MKRVKFFSQDQSKPQCSDIKSVEVLKTKEDIYCYLKEVLKYNPKIITFDYQTTGGSPFGVGKRILACSMCWQNIRSVSWEWKKTDLKLFRTIMNSNKIGKVDLYHEKEILWTKERVPRTTINNLIHCPSEKKFPFSSNKNKLIEIGLNSLYKYRLISNLIIELGVDMKRTIFPNTSDKKKIKKMYNKGIMFLPDAIQYLMFNCYMERNEALKYLGL